MDVNFEIFGALIGLAGAVADNGKTEKTDEIVISAMLNDDSAGAIREIHAEKFRISPGCENCSSPCGKTSDFSAERIFQCGKEIAQLKIKIAGTLKKIAMQRKTDKKPLGKNFFSALEISGCNLQKKNYENILEELKNEEKNHQD
jgi:hypothetical protein